MRQNTPSLVSRFSKSAPLLLALVLTACGSSEQEPVSGIDLRITNIEAAATIVKGGNTQVKIFWTSNRPPKYPMVRKTTVIKCPGKCDFGSREIPTATQPHVTAVYCGDLEGVIVLNYQLTDGNGEKSNIVEKTFTCILPGFYLN